MTRDHDKWIAQNEGRRNEEMLSAHPEFPRRVGVCLVHGRRKCSRRGVAE
jgi:hypothetical protein